MRHDLQYKLCTLADRICSQILYVDGSNEKAVVTVCALILGAMKYLFCSDLRLVFEVTLSETYSFDDPCNIKARAEGYLTISSL